MASVPATEEAWVKRLYRAVGGASALAGFNSPVTARTAVLAALSEQQCDAQAKARISRGDLTPLERRVVRTVTNRGAAGRSRVRQQRELARLRHELNRKDAEVRRLEAALKELSDLATPRPYSAASVAPQTATASSSIQSMSTCSTLPAGSPCNLAPHHGGSVPTALALEATLDRDMFGNLIDQLISPMS